MKSIIAALLVVITASMALAANTVETITNTIDMKFVKVPAGSFIMGTRTDKAIRADETPSHKVTISNDFWIGQYEVTQEQWYKVMGNNPSNFKKDGQDSRNFPMEKVSWNDAREFISRLNAKEGKQYRLPTEAEWEYACRSGGKDQKYCGGNDIDSVAWYNGNSGYRTHQIGTKRPNGLGIYDMSGNVLEWVSDCYGDYSNSPVCDPQGVSGGTFRIFRGGSWYDQADAVRSGYRYKYIPDIRDNDFGFRLVSPSYLVQPKGSDEADGSSGDSVLPGSSGTVN